jgi:hypothetical protein
MSPQRPTTVSSHANSQRLHPISCRAASWLSRLRALVAEPEHVSVEGTRWVISDELRGTCIAAQRATYFPWRSLRSLRHAELTRDATSNLGYVPGYLAAPGAVVLGRSVAVHCPLFVADHIDHASFTALYTSSTHPTLHMAWELYSYSGHGVVTDLNHFVGVSTTASDDATANLLLSTAEPVYDVTTAPDLWANVNQYNQIGHPVHNIHTTAEVQCAQHRKLLANSNNDAPSNSADDTIPNPCPRLPNQCHALPAHSNNASTDDDTIPITTRKVDTCWPWNGNPTQWQQPAKYTGICQRGPAYRARIIYRGQSIALGSYGTAAEAAAAYDWANLHLKARRCKLNFDASHYLTQQKSLMPNPALQLLIENALNDHDRVAEAPRSPTWQV